MCAAVAAAVTADEPRRPNVVLVLADDMTLADLQALPHTRELIGAAGTTFTESVVSYALCCPSRATILTGQYAHNHGVRSNRWPGGGYLAFRDEQALPAWLAKAGYHTVHIGKYLNGYGLLTPTEVPVGWTDWQGLVDPSTYRMYGYTLNNNGSLVTYGKAESDYQTDVISIRARDAINRFAGDGPFFLQIAPLAPHAESAEPAGEGFVRAAPRHAGMFTDLALPRGASFDEADVSDKPRLQQARPRLDANAVAALEALHRDRWRALAAVDELIVGVVGELDRHNILDNTVIIVTSDNGFFLGEHRVPGGKYLPYEPAIRVPLIVRGPGFRAGGVVSALAANVDIAATIAEVTGVTPGQEQDGISLLALERDEAAYASRAVLLEGLETGVDYMPPFLGVRTATHKYIRYLNGEVELYDLKADPDELDNLAGRSSAAGIEAELSDLLVGLTNCAGGSCRAAP